MTEPVSTPGQGSEQPPEGQANQQPGQQGGQVDWEARFKGTGPVINAKNEEIKRLQEEIRAKDEELGRNKGSFETSEITLRAQLQQTQATLEQTVKDKVASEASIKELKALKNRYEAVVEAAKTEPEIVLMMEVIPPMDDPEAQKVFVKNTVERIQAIKENTVKSARLGVPPQPLRPQGEEFSFSTDEEWKAASERTAGNPEQHSRVLAGWGAFARKNSQLQKG